MIKTQPGVEAIRSPPYLIGASHECINALSLDPPAPLHLRDVIFLNNYADLQAWLLANDCKIPLNFIVVASCHEEAGDDSSTPEPVGGRHSCFDRNVWDHSRQAEDIVGGMEWDDDDDTDDENDHNIVRNSHIRQQ